MDRAPSKRARHVEDHQMHIEGSELVRAVSRGSIGAWREFLNQYSGLVYSVVQRYLPAYDSDDIRSVYVDILKLLYDGDLQKYRGRTALSTWLFVYTGRRALDCWRAKNGRYREPKGFQYLNELDREVLRLYYIERMGIDIVVHMLNWNGDRITAPDIVESIQRIESTLDHRYLKRLDDENAARKNGANNVRLMSYVVHSKIEYEKQTSDNIPDSVLMKQEARQVADRVRLLVSKLPEDERRIIYLRFDKGMNAQQVSDKLGLDGQRKVYTVTERAIRKLRVSLKNEPKSVGRHGKT